MTDGAKIGMLFGMAFFAATAMDMVNQMEVDKKKKTRAKRKPPEVKPKKKSPAEEYITDLIETSPGVWEKQKA